MKVKCTKGKGDEQGVSQVVLPIKNHEGSGNGDRKDPVDSGLAGQIFVVDVAMHGRKVKEYKEPVMPGNLIVFSCLTMHTNHQITSLASSSASQLWIKIVG